MADPSTIGNEFKRTYELTVPILDIMGDAPVAAGTPVSVMLARTDGAADQPLFGPDGLLVGAMTQVTAEATARPPGTSLSPTTLTFALIPNGYWFVPTVYVLVAGGRTYQFTMPAEDTSLVSVLDGEATGGGPNNTQGTTPVAELPVVTSVDDATELANAQSVENRDPIFALVTADFGTYETGDVLVWQGVTDGWARLIRTHSLTPRNRGKLLTWWQAGGAAAIPNNAVEADILDDRPVVVVSHAGAAAAQTLYAAYPNALDASVESILIDGRPWTPAVLVKGATQVSSSVGYRLYAATGVDVTGGVGPMSLELVLR